MIKNLFEKFDKKRLKIVTELILILAFLVIIVNIVDRSYARYESTVDVSAEANVAFFVVDQGTYEHTISLTGLPPSLDAFYYDFYVANYNDQGRANVDLDYKITFETTTNLPLTYEIIRNESFEELHHNIIDDEYDRQDEYDVFYHVFVDDDTYSFTHDSNQVDKYTIKVIFPESKKDKPDFYQGVIELFSIIIDASQVA